MAAFREVFVRLADGTTETGFFKERGPGEPASLEIGVEVKVGQRVSFVGGDAEWEVKTAAWQRLAQWCHCDLVVPTPRRLPPPAPGLVAAAPDPAPEPAPAIPEPVAAENTGDDEEKPDEENADHGE